MIQDRERSGILLGLAAMTLFSLNDGIWKYALLRMPVSAVFFVTFAASALMLVLYARVAGISLKPHRWRDVTVVTILYALEQCLFVYALGHMPMAELFVIILTTPLFVLAGARVLLHEKLSWPQTLSVFSGFAGAAIVVLARVNDPVPVEASGAASLAALANVAVGGSKILYMRRHCRDENPFCLSLGLALALCIPCAVIAGPALLHLPAFETGSLCFGSILATAGALAYVVAAQRARAPLMSATQYSQIVWAMLIGAVFFHEGLSHAGLAGAALIAVSFLLLYGRLLRTRAPL